MIKTYLALCICLVVVAEVSAQRRAKAVKQPREVIEAYRVCEQFKRVLAENFDFDRAFEATFTKDPARRRAIAISEGEHGNGDLSQVDNETVLAIYKDEAQVLILMLPLLFGGDEAKAQLFPPPIEAMFDRKPPDDPQQLQAYAVQLHQDVADLRAHVNQVATAKPDVAKNLAEYKKYLLTPLERPKRIVKPLTAYSKGTVLPTDAKYYQIDDCAIVNEDGQMRMIGYTFFKLRW